MPFVNRCAVFVWPKEPFLEWCRIAAEDPSLTLDDLRREPGAFLLSQYDLEDDKIAVLEYFYDLIFDHLLAAWIEDEDAWPEERTFKVFTKWFDVQFSSMVVDLEDAPLTTQE